MLCQSRNMVGQFKKTYLHTPIEILHFLTPARIKKMFNITSKYFSFFNNKPPASWIAHITRDFLTCYFCLYSSFMIIVAVFYFSPYPIDSLACIQNFPLMIPIYKSTALNVNGITKDIFITYQTLNSNYFCFWTADTKKHITYLLHLHNTLQT